VYPVRETFVKKMGFATTLKMVNCIAAHAQIGLGMIQLVTPTYVSQVSALRFIDFTSQDDLTLVELLLII
jgi:hypothetical protein